MGKWFADGEPLSTVAWNVQNRSAAWSMPGRRGENSVVAGRSGSVPSFGPFDEGRLPLSMWAVGCNEDGTFPTGSRAIQCRQNLDAITKLLGRPGLVEVAYVEDESVAYGRVNLEPNPSFENADGKIVVQENVIANPNAELSEVDRPVRRNFALNPNGSAFARDLVYRQNLVPNPRMRGEGLTVVMRTNLAENPSFERGMDNWRSVGSATVIDRVKTIAGTMPKSGAWSARAVIDATGHGLASSRMPAVVGTTYTAQAYVRNQSGATATVTATLVWLKSDGTVISTSAGTGVSLIVTAESLISVSAAAPALTKFMFLRITANAATTILVDNVQVEAAATVGSWFAGGQAEVDGIRYRWVDEAGRSASEAYRVVPRGWTAPGASYAALTSFVGLKGQYSARINVGSATTDVEVFRENFNGAALVGDLTRVSGQLSMLLGVPGASAVRTVKVFLDCYDANGVSLGKCVTTQGGGTPMTPIAAILNSDGWVTVLVEDVWTRDQTAGVALVVSIGAAGWTIGENFYATAAMVEVGSAAHAWFDGAMAPDDTFGYDWDGEPHWSTSTQQGFTLDEWTPKDGFQFQTKNPVILAGGAPFDDFAIRVQPKRSIVVGDRPGITQITEDVQDGRSHYLSMYVNPSRTQNLRVRIGYTVAGVTTYTDGTSTSCTLNTWTRLSVTAVAPDPVDSAIIVIETTADPVALDYYDVGGVLFEPTSELRTWFDGNSGTHFSWEEEEFVSISQKTLPWPTGWHPTGTAYPVVDRFKSALMRDSYVARVVTSQPGVGGVSFQPDGVDEGTGYAFGVDVYLQTARSVTAGIRWIDTDGNVLSTTTTVTAVAATTLTRMAVTGTAPTGAVAARCFVSAAAMIVSEFMYVDSAIFGFGASTTYKDGTSASWSWVDEVGGESENKSPAPAYWDAINGTFARSATFTTNRTYGGEYVATASGTNRIFGLNKGDGDRKRFPLNQAKTYYWGIDIRSPTDGQARLRFIPCVWTGAGWKASTTPDIFGSKVAHAANTTVRLTFSGQMNTGDATHFRPCVEFFDSNGNNVLVGAIRRVDSMMLSTYNDMSYADGEDTWVQWLGDADASRSRTVGPAKRCMVQFRNAFDMSSMAGGSRAEFSVDGVIPGAFWESTKVNSKTMPIGRRNSILTLQHLDGSTAPIEDAVLRIYGPFDKIRLTDMGSGAWFEFDPNHPIRETGWLDVDCGSWDVTDRRGRSRIMAVSHGGAYRLLPLTVESDHTAPRLQVSGRGWGDGTRLRVQARKKYLIA